MALPETLPPTPIHTQTQCQPAEAGVCCGAASKPWTLGCPGCLRRNQAPPRLAKWAPSSRRWPTSLRWTWQRGLVGANSSPWTVCRKVPCPGQRRPLPLLHALLHACDGAAANAAAPHTCCAAAPHDIPRRYRRRTRRPRRRDGAARDEWSAVDCRQVARQLARCHGGQGRVSGREGAPP